MSVLMVRSNVKGDCVAQVEAAAGKVFAALQQEQPNGVRYASCKLADGVTFVVLLEVGDGAENPLPAMSAFREFQEGLKSWVAGPPNTEQLEVVGSYRLFAQGTG